MLRVRHAVARSVAPALMLAGCSGGAEKGTAKFTTWGEEYIEQQIPADPEGQAGFLDGWTLHYDKFLVAFHAITVADSSGRVGATMPGSRFVDNTRSGRKELVTFPDLEAKAWDRVSYQIKPALSDSVIVAGDAADRDMMVEKGYAIYIEGSATKDAAGAPVVKTFRLGFTTATAYEECHSEQDGKDTAGIVVTNGSTDVSELTTHGDHFYYDRLQASPNPAIKTSLRFDEKAVADEAPIGNGDGEITLAELSAETIDVTKYDPSGLDVPTIGAFMIALARTVGHFRGEGECTISRIDP